MSRERKTYPKEFKLIIVELSNKRTDLAELANELDVKPSLLYRWRKDFSEKQTSSFPGNGKVILSSAEQELAQLKKELRETQMECDILKKAISIFSKGRQQIFGFIKTRNKIFLVKKIRSVFKVSRSGFYRWLTSSPSKRRIENELIECEMMQIFEQSKKAYGSPASLLSLIKTISKLLRPRIARMMQKAKLRSIVKKRFKVTTDSQHKFSISENILDRDFKPGVLGLA